MKKNWILLRLRFWNIFQNRACKFWKPCYIKDLLRNELRSVAADGDGTVAEIKF